MTTPRPSRTRLGRLLAAVLLCFTTGPADAARFQFVQPANVSWGVLLGGTRRISPPMQPLGSFYSRDLWSIRPGGQAGSRMTLHTDVLGFRSATLNLSGGGYADARNTPAQGVAFTAQSNPSSWAVIPVRILPTAGEANGKTVRVTLRSIFLCTRSGSGTSQAAARLAYFRPGDRLPTMLYDVVTNHSVSPTPRTATFNARVGDTFYVASYYAFYCSTNTSNSGELRLEMTVE